MSPEMSPTKAFLLGTQPSPVPPSQDSGTTQSADTVHGTNGKTHHPTAIAAAESAAANSSPAPVAAVLHFQSNGYANGNHEVVRPGVSSNMLARAQVKRVEEWEAARLTGHKVRGVVIPYIDGHGSPMLGNDGRPFCRIRLDEPLGSAKYLSAVNSGCQLYIPPGLLPHLVPGCTLLVVEGEFKSMALVEAGFACVGIGGITSAAPRDAEGVPQLLPDLAGLITHLRPKRLAFVGDSDTCLIPAFSREAVKLAQLAGVPVVLPRIPLDSPGKGPDDLRELWKDEFAAKWQAILDQAEPVTANTEATQLAVRLLRREGEAFGNLDADAKDKARKRLVQLALACQRDPLAFDSIAQFAADYADLSKATLRDALRVLKEQASSKQPSDGKRPRLVLPGGHVTITEAAEEIFAAIAQTHELFYRGGRAHRVVKEPDGTHRLVPVTAVQFRSRIEKYGELFVWRAGQDSEPVLKPTTCPQETAHALLESEAAEVLLPNITRVSACPILAKTPNGAEELAPGWHAIHGGIFITGGDKSQHVGLDVAVAMLKEIVQDFDFATSGDRSRALASFITPALLFGGWLTGYVPIDIGEADASQSGKTYRQKLIAAVYREVPNIVVQRSGGVGGTDESFSQKLIDGRPFVLVDNVRGKLDSQFLESILTSPGKMPARVPHKGEIEVDARGFIFQFTSNGAETTRDLANRASIVRIRKRPDAYQFTHYRDGGDVYGNVKALQPWFLGAVFAVVREWIAKGQLRTTEHRHSFRDWAQVSDWIVQNIFREAPLLDGHNEARQRLSDPRRTWLRSLAIALRDAEMLGELQASELAEFAIEYALPPPNARDDANEDNVARCIGRVMKAIFGESPVVEIDSFKVHRGIRYSKKAEKVVPVYRFE